MTSPIDPKLLEILACPACKEPVDLVDDSRLVCRSCRRAYPIRDGIPIMLVDEATFEGGGKPSEGKEPQGTG